MEILREISAWFLLFIIYSFGGWFMEMVITVFIHHRIYNRGFLIGPLCPIYGVGGVLVALILGQQEHILEIFCVVVLLGGMIEYSTSYIMEKLFHARWWDYSDQPFNLNGRICLTALLGFGALGVAAVKFINPFLFSVFARFNDATIISIAGAIFLILVIDILISLCLITRFRNTAKTMQGDVTEEVTEYIRSSFNQRGKLNRRLLRAFPTMEVKKPTTRKTKNVSKHKAGRTSKRSSK